MTATPRPAKVFSDERGRLTLADFGSLPFEPSRAYVLDRIPRGGRRAGHASRAQHRQLIAISGLARVELDDGSTITFVTLQEGIELYVPPGVWFELEAVGDHLSVLVLASGEYDPADYMGRPSAPLDSDSRSA